MRVRAILGLAAGVLMVASSAAHSLLGWKGMSAALARANAPPDLVAGLAMGWHFGGAAMLAFGWITLWQFAGLIRGRPLSTVPTFVIGLFYLAFGIGAVVVNGANPFFLVFLVPGALLLAASSGRDRAAPAPAASHQPVPEREPAGV